MKTTVKNLNNGKIVIENRCREHETVNPVCSVGDVGTLGVYQDESANAVRNGTDGPQKFRLFSRDGIPGNSDPAQVRTHGWRGSWDNVALYAHGVRRVDEIRPLKRGTGMRYVFSAEIK